MAYVRDMNDGEWICEELFERLEKVELRLFDETLEQLGKLDATAERAANEVLQVLTMCKLTDDFTPYYDYLKNWDDEQIN